jgi:F-type H+-transporting ATPase subunit gamma
MAVGKEIRTQIKSVGNTQKITKAMEMVAASKLRKTQERMTAARPYANKVRNVIAHLYYANTEYQHPFLEQREVKRVGYIVISTDRGLCGGLNTNMFRALTLDIRQQREAGRKLDFCVIGNKASSFLKRMGGNVLSQTSHLGDTPSFDDLITPVQIMIREYEQGQIDQLFLVYNELVNTMTQRPTIQQLLPVSPRDETQQDMPKKHSWDYIYEPNAKQVLDLLLKRYIEACVYRAVVENIACEMAARMLAMKSASDNAGTIIDDLQLVYNKARQAAITQELSEIVGGAAAV